MQDLKLNYPMTKGKVYSEDAEEEDPTPMFYAD